MTNITDERTHQRMCVLSMSTGQTLLSSMLRRVNLREEGMSAKCCVTMASSIVLGINNRVIFFKCRNWLPALEANRQINLIDD